MWGVRLQRGDEDIAAVGGGGGGRRGGREGGEGSVLASPLVHEPKRSQVGCELKTATTSHGKRPAGKAGAAVGAHVCFPLFATVNELP